MAVSFKTDARASVQSELHTDSHVEKSNNTSLEKNRDKLYIEMQIALCLCLR